MLNSELTERQPECVLFRIDIWRDWHTALTDCAYVLTVLTDCADLLNVLTDLTVCECPCLAAKIFKMHDAYRTSLEYSFLCPIGIGHLKSNSAMLRFRISLMKLFHTVGNGNMEHEQLLTPRNENKKSFGKFPGFACLKVKQTRSSTAN